MPITIDNKAKKEGGNDDCFNIFFGHKLIEQDYLLVDNLWKNPNLFWINGHQREHVRIS